MSYDTYNYRYRDAEGSHALSLAGIPESFAKAVAKALVDTGCTNVNLTVERKTDPQVLFEG